MILTVILTYVSTILWLWILIQIFTVHKKGDDAYKLLALTLIAFLALCIATVMSIIY